MGGVASWPLVGAPGAASVQPCTHAGIDDDDRGSSLHSLCTVCTLSTLQSAVSALGGWAVVRAAGRPGLRGRARRAPASLAAGVPRSSLREPPLREY